MKITNICPLCGHSTATMEASQDGFSWYIIRCKNCYTFHIHESVFTQITDSDTTRDVNQRKRLNCIYDFLLKHPVYRGFYYYQFFYEIETKDVKPDKEVRVNIASIINEMPTKTKDKLKAGLKNLIDKYGIGNEIKTDMIDDGLVLVEEKNDKQSFLEFYSSHNLIDKLDVSEGKIKSFKLTLNAKMYLEEEGIMETPQNTNVTNITDNSIHIGDVKNIKKSNIGQNDIKTDKEINSNIETNIVRERKNGLFSWFKKKK